MAVSVARRALLAAAVLTLAPAGVSSAATTYRNPVPIVMTNGERVETFADPSIIEAPDESYVAYATSDPLNGRDRKESGELRLRRIPFARSRDLVNWTYQGEALASVPAWAAPDSSLWAPDIRKQGERYLLYFTVVDSSDAVSGESGCTFDPAIGVAVSDSPSGPFVPTAEPVVAPRRGDPAATSSGPSTQR